jgi:hypothetical protein
VRLLPPDGFILARAAEIVLAARTSRPVTAANLGEMTRRAIQVLALDFSIQLLAVMVDYKILVSRGQKQPPALAGWHCSRCCP